jgi:hypothetical protein
VAHTRPQLANVGKAKPNQTGLEWGQLQLILTLTLFSISTLKL